MRQPAIAYLFVGSVLVLLVGVFVTVGIPALGSRSIGTNAQASAYTEQEMRGRRIYIREGCVGCHTQQVRAIDVERGTVYQRGDIGPESQPGGYAFQRPLLWGTNRQGPDLAHVSSRPYATKEWHIRHLRDPRSVTPGSLMPNFGYLSEEELEELAGYLLALR